MDLRDRYLVQAAYAQAQQHRRDDEFWMTSAALRLYQRARNSGKLGQIWSALTGRARHLLDLGCVQATCVVRGRYYIGTRTVPIDQIRGSEGRCKDFDASFRPLRSHNQGRWVSLAVAMRMGVSLPLVKLIRVGDVYFARDGHHRISVAKALGQTEIDAEVTVWEVAGTLPWEQAVIAGRAVHQPVKPASTPGRARRSRGFLAGAR